MRKLATILAAFLVLQSCNSVYFSDAQPVESPVLKEFPRDLTGSFVSETEDTLVVKPTSFIFRGGDPVFLSGDLTPKGCVLKKMNDWYVISLQDEKEWEVFPVKFSGTDNFTIYYIDMEENEENRIIKDLRKKMKVEESLDQDGTFDHYIVSPSKSQFQELLTGKLFSEEMSFTRIE